MPAEKSKKEISGVTLITIAFKNKEVERIPWVPFVGCHGGKLIGVSAEKYLQSADYIVAGLAKAYRKYHPDGLPIMFDLQIEAEAMGCSRSTTSLFNCSEYARIQYATRSTILPGRIRYLYLGVQATWYWQCHIVFDNFRKRLICYTFPVVVGTTQAWL